MQKAMLAVIPTKGFITVAERDGEAKRLFDEVTAALKALESNRSYQYQEGQRSGAMEAIRTTYNVELTKVFAAPCVWSAGQVPTPAPSREQVAAAAYDARVEAARTKWQEKLLAISADSSRSGNWKVEQTRMAELQREEELSALALAQDKLWARFEASANRRAQAPKRSAADATVYELQRSNALLVLQMSAAAWSPEELEAQFEAVLARGQEDPGALSAWIEALPALMKRLPAGMTGPGFAVAGRLRTRLQEAADASRTPEENAALDDLAYLAEQRRDAGLPAWRVEQLQKAGDRTLSVAHRRAALVASMTGQR